MRSRSASVVSAKKRRAIVSSPRSAPAACSAIQARSIRRWAIKPIADSISEPVQSPSRLNTPRTISSCSSGSTSPISTCPLACKPIRRNRCMTTARRPVVIAYAVHESRVREVLGIDLGEAETEAFWTEFLFSLKARGLQGVRLCVSDAHQGLVNAIARVLGCRWQRCTVHFLRNMLGHCGRSQQPMIATAIRQIFRSDSAVEARQCLIEVTERLREPAPKVCQLLEDACEELLCFYAF